jgi:hypothetical protein
VRNKSLRISALLAAALRAFQCQIFERAIYPDWQAHEWPSPPSGRCAARRLLEASKQQQHQQQQQTLRSPFVQMNPASN